MDDVWSDPQAITGERFIPLSHTMPCVMSTHLPARLQEWEGNGTGKIAHMSVTMVIPLLWITEYFHQRN